MFTISSSRRFDKIHSLTDHRNFDVTHLVIRGCIHRKKQETGNVLFNDALNTFYLRLYGVRHMVKGHSDNERGNLLPPHELLFPITSKGSFICIIPQTEKHIPRLEREIAQWVHHEEPIRRHIATRANTLTTELHLAPFIGRKPVFCIRYLNKCTSV